LAASTNQVLAKFADSLDWTVLAITDVAECCCQHAGRNDATAHANGSPCHIGASVCLRCAESWSWDYQLRYGPPVRITTARAAVIKTQRVDQGIAWTELASTTGIPHGTISSIGYAPQNMHPFELRLLTNALRMPTQRVLDVHNREPPKRIDF